MTPEAIVAPDANVGANIRYGSGKDGELAITDRRSVNAYAPLAKNADVGARSITVGRAASTMLNPVKPGDVVLLVQSALPGERPDAGADVVEADTVGTWELVSATAVNGDVVDLSAPLAHAFAASGAQAVVVPQYTKLEIGPTGIIAPPRWDGFTGGIIAILATDSVMLNGSVEANNAGFRGGRAAMIATTLDCSALEGLVDAGFAPRGEGYGSGDAGFGGLTGGRGNWANGGGGGDCHNSGGAGGGNGGRGGAGGDSQDTGRPVGGLGGSAVALPKVSRLRFGGGGGAGETNNSTNPSGGPGGGVIFIRAPKVAGIGQIVARGGGGNSAGVDGAGGGGAGGTIYLDVAAEPVCTRIGITGGGGGNVTTLDAGTGPGGGGGGGVLYVKADYLRNDAGIDASAEGGVCMIEPNAGAPGTDGTLTRNAGPPDGTRDEPPYVGIVSPALTP